MAETKKTKAGGKPRLTLPVIVEGRYDKSAILSMFDGLVLVTDGFGIFNSKEKQALLRKVAHKGSIVLTDSDGGGKQIRSFLSGILPKDKIINLFIPEIEGKVRRKTKASKAGLLGVEGVGAEVLMSVFDKFIDKEEAAAVEALSLTAADLYTLGLSGGEDSLRRRDLICRRSGLPTGMRAKAFLAAVNLIFTENEWRKALDEVDFEKDS